MYKPILCNKNNIRGVYKHKLWFCLALGALVFAIGCKQANNGGGQKPDVPIETNEITITVKGDDGVEVKKTNSFKVKKSSIWKDIK